MRRSVAWQDFDFVLLALVATTTALGVAIIRSAVAGNQVLSSLPTRQLIFAGVGFAALILIALVDYHYWIFLGRYLYFLTIGLLLFLNIVGQARFGSARWIDTGFFLIQPSEFAKIVIIVTTADFLSRHKEQLHQLRWVILSFLYTMGLVVWVLLQPDLSTSITLLVIWFAQVWAAGLELKHLGLFVVLGLGAAAAGFPFLADYQKARVINFLFPDPNARHGAIYNVLQALTAIGSGGLMGKGYGHGTQVQSRFLKVRHTDFIFAVIGEEFGFVGALLVLLLLTLIILRCLHVARTAHDTFGALLAYGVAAMLFFHTLVNVAMNLNMVPVTGLPLPFISYGGSTLISTLIGIGLVESVAVYRNPLQF